MLPGSTAMNIAANEAALADDITATLTASGKINTMTYSRNQYNTETSTTELVKYLMLTFRWDTNDRWIGLSKVSYPIPDKYM